MEEKKLWYVVNAYSGHEQKVKDYLESRRESMGMENNIFRVIIPQRTEIEVKDGVKKAQPCVLEPMMKVEIEIPDEFTGTIIGDISRRRGRVEGQEPQGNTGNVIVRALVPLANMFGYATDLRSNTQGRGTFSMEFKCYEQVPRNIEEEIISKSGAKA